MANNFKEFFRNQGFGYRDGLYYQHKPTRNDFEKKYLALRTVEGRLYSDEIVKNLPVLSTRHPLQKEWKIRERSANRLVHYLRDANIQNILEIGCGNGWLSNYVHKSLHASCCGIDINETELLQAAKLFSNDTMTFAYADVLSAAFDQPIAGAVILASVIQYFPDLTSLFLKLKQIVQPLGEIHILDSPIYIDDVAWKAKERSANYFKNVHQEGMDQYYHHHTWRSLHGIKYDVLYDSQSTLRKMKRVFRNDSPFPWVRVVV